MNRREDRGGARRLYIDSELPAPTVMAGGIGSVNTSQYSMDFCQQDRRTGKIKRRNLDMRRRGCPRRRILDRPPYKIPSMAEIAKTPLNGFCIVSLFSGTGGSCLGYRMAGFEVVWANEFEPNAAENYRLNFPDTILDTRDIRKIGPEEILNSIGKGRGEIDLLDGSPPCQSFSTAGKRQKSWGKVTAHGDGTTQRSDDLFFEYARLLDGLKPKVFIAENVSGLAKGVAKGYFKEIFAALEKYGYVVKARLLDAQWLGVPQARQRIFFVGVHTDLAEKYKIGPVFPAPLPYRYSVLAAISDLLKGDEKPEKPENPENPSPTITAHQCADTGFNPPLKIRVSKDTGGQFGAGEITNRPSPTIRASGSGHLRVEVPEMSPGIGGEWDKIRPGEASSRYFQLVKAHPDKPSPTVTAAGGQKGIASVVHFAAKRKFSIAELKRICSFSDDFRLVGSYAKQWARLGNSVPPLMAFHIARAIRDEILAKLR